MFVKLSGKKLKIKDCKGFDSISGLMFNDMKVHKGALIYSNNVWMPFVRHELDLLFLDKNHFVIDIQKAVPLSFNPKTWRVYKNKKAKYCLEIKADTVSVKRGMKIIFE
jgi:uncharacterized membrane protein (UPF0127 family)